MSQRMASAVRRSGRTSTGTWSEAPPTRRLFTSSAGLAFVDRLLEHGHARLPGALLDQVHRRVEDPLGQRSSCPRSIRLLTNLETVWLS